MDYRSCIAGSPYYRRSGHKKPRTCTTSPVGWHRQAVGQPTMAAYPTIKC